MKILVLCYEFPPIGGGGGRVVWGLTRTLAQSGHDVDVVTMGYRGLPRFERLEGVNVYRVPSLRRRVSDCSVWEAASYLLGALPTLWRLLRTRRYGLNHTHFIFPDGLLAWLINRLTGLPYVITAHGTDVPGYNPHRLKATHRLLQPLWHIVVGRASRVIAPSEGLKALILAQAPQAPVTVVPNGFDKNQFRTDQPRAKRVLLVTRMVERKGIQYALQALQGLSMDGYEVEIVGDGPYLSTLREIAARSRLRVTFRGWLDNTSNDLRHLYETSRIFVLPSEAENFPVCLLEAMASGLAIITTQGTGCVEVVGDAALTVPVKNAQAIRTALTTLIQDEGQRTQLGQAARRRLEAQFHWPVVADRYVEVYSEALKERKGFNAYTEESKMKTTERPKVLVIALAEATLDLIVPWARAGVLPTFKKLMDEGSWGPLRSRLPLIVPQLWGTIATGQNPGQHGALGFWQRGADGRFRPADGSRLQAKTIWQWLSERGLRCGIVNVPFTYPPQPLDNGFMISGEDAPGAHRSIASPSALYDELVQKFGRYRLKDIFPGGRKKEDYLTLIGEDISKQTEVLDYLVSKKPWDFLLVFSHASAIAQHYFWSDMESNDPSNPYSGLIENAYRGLDAQIGRLIDAAGPNTQVFVISECGAGRLQSGVQVNTWLAQEGFLTRKSSPKKQAAKNGKSKGGQSRRLVAMLRTRMQGMLPQSLHFWANKYAGGMKEWIQTYLCDSDIDWAKTRVFSRGKEGEIYVNLKGRDPQGIVEPGVEYEALRDTVIERLSGLIDPATGKQAVDRVYRREELFKGPNVGSTPDLIIAWRDTAYQPTESDRDRDAVFVDRWREYMEWPTTGSHRVDGIFFAKGPGIRRDQQIKGAGIVDLMPTWLSALGQPAPEKLEGRVLADLFEQASERTPQAAKRK